MKNKHIHSIEGLRAFAVLFVIAFHFEIFNVTGGYIGVEAASILIDDRFKRTEFSEGVEYWSIKDQLCNADGCLIRVGDELSKDLIVYDYGHLTKAGSQFITSKFKLQFLN
jgi:hypothetical protein